MKKTFIMICCICPIIFFGQKVERSKNELKEAEKKEQGNKENKEASNNDSSSDLDLDTVGLILKIFSYLTFYGAVGDYENEEHLSNSLSKYPYIDEYAGNFTDLEKNKTNFRLDIENIFLVETLNSIRSSYANHFKVKAHFKQYFYGQFDQKILFEKYKGYPSSNLSIYQLNIGYDRIRIEHFNLGFLLGVNYISSGINKTGFNYGFHADFFIGNNISLDGTLLWSRINSLPVNSTDIKVKYHFGKNFISAGYEHMRIATPSYNYITVGVGTFL